MNNLQELKTNDLSKINGGIVWLAPLAGWAAKGVAAYVAWEVTDGVIRGIAGGDYVPSGEIIPCQ